MVDLFLCSANKRRPSSKAKRRGKPSAPSESADADDDMFVIDHAMIENPARLALELSASLHMVTLLLNRCVCMCNACRRLMTSVFCSYLNMAELRFLQRDVASAVSFWAECRDLMLVTFFDGGARSSPSHSPLKVRAC